MQEIIHKLILDLMNRRQLSIGKNKKDSRRKKTSKRKKNPKVTKTKKH